MYQDLEHENNETKQIFQGLVEQVKRENKSIFNRIIQQKKTNFFKILDFQKQFTQQINTIEFESLCCLYLYSFSSRKEQHKQEIDEFILLITKLSKLKELVQLIKSLKQENETIEKLVQLRDYLLSCIIKFYFLIYNIKYDEEFGFHKYYNLVDKLITKKKVHNYSSLEQIQQEILQSNIISEQNKQYNQEKFFEIIIKTTSQYFSYYLFNPQLISKINKLIKRHIFQYQDRWITQLTNFMQIINPQSDIFTENNNLLNKQQGFVLKILYLQQHLVDSFYKMATRLLSQGNYLFGIKMLRCGLHYRSFWQKFGFKIDVSKDYQYLLNCCQYVLSVTNKYKSQLLLYQSFAYSQLSQYDKGQIALEEAISIDNKNINYLIQKGNIFLYQGQFEKARNLYEEYQQFLKDALSLNNLGLTYYKQKDFKRSLSLFQQAYQMKNYNIGIKYNIIRAFFELEQFDECLKQCDSVIGINPYLINVYLFKIRILINKDKQKDAIQQLKNLKLLESSNQWVINYDQLNYEYFYKLGLYQNEQKQYSSSIYYMFNSIKLNPISQIMKIGTNLQDLQDDELKEFYKKINEQLKLDQNNCFFLSIFISCYLQISAVHFEQKTYSRYSFIVNNLTQLINIEEIKNSYSQELAYYILQVCIVRFYFFEALDQYFKLQEDSKFKRSISQNYLPLIYQQTGQLYEYLIYQQIQNDQDQLNLELMEGYFLFQQNNFNEAEGYFEKQIQLNPKNLDARLILGNIYQKLKKYDESIIQFDYITNLDKANKWAYTQKAYSYFCMGLKDQIYPLYQQASKFCPNQIELIICNAIYLYECQQFQQALELFDLLFKIDKKIDYVQFKYGMTYYELNDKRNALNKFTQRQKKMESFVQFMNQGFIYEKQNMSKAIQFYVDIISIFNYKEQQYINERISILKNSQQRENIKN